MCHLRAATVCLRWMPNALNRRRPRPAVPPAHQWCPALPICLPSQPTAAYQWPSPARPHHGPATANCPRSQPHRAPQGPVLGSLGANHSSLASAIQRIRTPRASLPAPRKR
ncbi:hypothetical protein BD289DRAFT_187371 [Coniella lustricola]|uniref:Uncharacterized protein n=1 Tax=Coniella lustricola TaxID=2025994 RepID=A0A2T3AD61_9PEZI|nr:hypothetical protein BD289DRAFT_187371 [Coniella lustricola]